MSPKPRFGYRSQAQSQSRYDIFMYGIVGIDFDANTFIGDLANIPIGTKDVHLYLHSDGGIVTEGYAIMTNIMRQKKKFNFTSHIDGAAYSMMSAIATATHRTIASPFSSMMIHDPWKWVDIFGAYNKKDIEQLIEELESQKDALDSDSTILAGIYASKTGLSISEVKSKWLEDGFDHFFTPDQMLEFGLIDAIEEDQEFPDFPEFEPDFEDSDFLAKLSKSKVAYRGAFERQINRFALNTKISDSNNTDDDAEANLDKTKGNKMNELQSIARLLDMNPDASVDSIRNEVERIQGQVADLNKKIEKHESLIEEYEKSDKAKDEKITALRAESIKAKTSTVVAEVVDEVEGEKGNAGKEVNKNITDDLTDLAEDYLEAKAEGDEKAMNRARQHMTLVAKANLIEIGSSKKLDTAKGDEERQDEESTVADLKKAREEGQKAREARKKLVTVN